MMTRVDVALAINGQGWPLWQSRRPEPRQFRPKLANYSPVNLIYSSVYMRKVETSPMMRNSVFMALEIYKQVLRDKTILVVDDNADMRSLLRTVFRSLGAQVYSAECVDDALDSYRKEKPDLLVSDVCMPRRDGFDLIHAIHDELEAEVHAKTPAIAISAADLIEVRSAAIESGFSAHFFKPFDLQDLLEAAAELIVARRQPAVWVH